MWTSSVVVFPRGQGISARPARSRPGPLIAAREPDCYGRRMGLASSSSITTSDGDDDVGLSPRNLVALRVTFIGIGSLLYPLVMGEVGDRPWLAWSVLGLTLVHAAFAWGWSRAGARASTSPLLTTLLEVLVVTTWLFATGGFDSPFFFVVYIAVVLAAIRSSVAQTLIAAGLYGAAYLGLAATSGALSLARLDDVLIRCAYVLVAAALGVMVASQRLRQTSARQQARREAQQRQLDEQLYAAERLAALGTLAGGVGHEINNPLTWVITNLSFARSALEGQAPASVLEALEDATDGAARISTIVQDLKVFTRGDQTLGLVDVPALLRTALKMAGNEIRHRARLHEELDAVPPVLADQARLGQVFLNLLANAAQAMETGKADENELRVRTRLSDGGDVVVEIEDTGPGIPAAVVERVFEPFYTTRPAGEGMGLGLAISHGIVVNLGGRMELDSEQGRGTTVRVLLPSAHTSAAEPLPDDNELRAVRLRVLVVDDEPLILRAIPRMLPDGIEVETTASGREALDRVKAGEHYDVILSDLIMPVMSGMELHQALHDHDPLTARRMVFMTGGAFTDDARAFLARDGVRWLEKPIDPIRLVVMLRDQARAGMSED